MTFSDEAQETILKEGKTSYQSIKVECAAHEGEADELLTPHSVNTSFKKKLIGLLAAGLACSALALSLFTSDRPSGENMTPGLKKWGEKGDLPSGEVVTPLMGMTSCEDVPNWTDGFDDGCDWYERFFPPGCAGIRSAWTGSMGPATEGCCHCGGGIVTTPSPTTPAPTPIPTPSPSKPNECPDGKPFNITLINTGTNTDYDALFLKAKKRWESIIKCGLSNFGSSEDDWFKGDLPQPYTGPVDDIVIGYVFQNELVDKIGNPYFGEAGKRFTRNTGSSISGIMRFSLEGFRGLSDGQ